MCVQKTSNIILVNFAGKLLFKKKLKNLPFVPYWPSLSFTANKDKTIKNASKKVSQQNLLLQDVWLVEWKNNIPFWPIRVKPKNEQRMILHVHKYVSMTIYKSGSQLLAIMEVDRDNSSFFWQHKIRSLLVWGMFVCLFKCLLHTGEDMDPDGTKVWFILSGKKKRQGNNTLVNRFNWQYCAVPST